MPKLVRDRIPELIKSKGQLAKTRQLSQQEYLSSLKDKLQEEVQEFLEDPCLEELGDIQEVIHALAIAHGHTVEELRQEQERKREERGGFTKRIWLEKVES